MTLEYVDSLPKRRTTRPNEHGKLRRLLQEFADSGKQVAKVHISACDSVCGSRGVAANLLLAAQASKLPVKVCTRGTDIYLVRI